MKKLLMLVLGVLCMVLGASVAAAELPAGYTAVDAIVVPRGAGIGTSSSKTAEGCWDENYNRSAFAFGNDGTGIYAGYGNQGGTFGRNFVPARIKDEQQIVGLYDTVSGEFYALHGGTLTLGKKGAR